MKKRYTAISLVEWDLKQS